VVNRPVISSWVMNRPQWSIVRWSNVLEPLIIGMRKQKVYESTTYGAQSAFG